MRKVELSLKEKEKYEIIKKLVETNRNKEHAKIKLHLKSIRQINRLIAGYKEYGKEFFIHGNRGRKPKHALSSEFKDEIETLYTSKYFDCTYTQFAEYLAENENIFLSVAEVGQILRERYILSPRARKVTKKNIKKKLLAEKTKAEKAKIQSNIVAVEDAHPRQPRCIYFGEEIQTDACIHLWFGKTKTALHAAIDDSTGRVVAAYFDNQETLNGTITFTTKYLQNMVFHIFSKQIKELCLNIIKKALPLTKIIPLHNLLMPAINLAQILKQVAYLNLSLALKDFSNPFN